MLLDDNYFLIKIEIIHSFHFLCNTIDIEHVYAMKSVYKMLFSLCKSIILYL